jgi:flagellar hook-basal body complex protein FliE
MDNTISSGLPILPVTPPTSPTAPAGPAGQEGGFGDTLKNAISQVDQLHQDSQTEISELLHGDRQDLHNVMIAVEKADIAFQLMMQVRNKIVNAYQEVSKLQF